MQARFRAATGTASSSSAPIFTCVHQQGGCSTPVSRWRSMAQRFSAPHSGQRLGKMEVAVVTAAS